jgi:hypothetical protein
MEKKFSLAEWPLASFGSVTHAYHGPCGAHYAISTADSLMQVILDHECEER